MQDASQQHAHADDTVRGDARRPAAARAAADGSAETTLAAKLAAARRNGVVCVDDSGTRFWLQKPTMLSMAQHKAAATQPTPAPWQPAAAPRRHRPPSYHRRLERRARANSHSHGSPQASGAGNAVPRRL